MASTLAKLVASKILRVRSVSSSPRFFNTKPFQYVQHDSQDKCILKHDYKHGSFPHAIVKYAFSPHVSPTRNLARLLSVADVVLGFKHGFELLPMWTAVEDEKTLYLLRDMTGKQKFHAKESVRELEYMSRLNEVYVEQSVPGKEFMSGIHKKDVRESVPKNFMSGIHEKDVTESVLEELMSSMHEFVKDVKESVPNKKTVPERDLGALIDLMRGVSSAPGEYYYEVMQNAEDVNSFVQSRIKCLIGTRMFGAVESKAHLLVEGVDYNPKAVYIVVELGTHLDTNDLYGGYAIEIFSQDGFFNVTDVEKDFTSEMWKIVIPKKKGERIQTIEGNLIFFRQKKYAN
ncbi:hypothetical protein Tco_0719921 [Tanacetum coccineum]